MNDSAVGFPIWSEIRFSRSEFEELETRVWIKFEPFKNGNEDVVGEMKREMVDSMEAMESEDATDSVE